MKVVLVHGAWHGAWCWDRVVEGLEAQEVDVETIDLPFTSLEDDDAATRALLDAIDEPVVLCGHSYGGAVITQAGHHPAVEHLVYVAAFALDEGESLSAVAPDENLPSRPVADALVFSADGTTTSVDPDRVVEFFFHDCDPDDAANAVANLRPVALACLSETSGPPAWRDTPTTYAVCTEDQAVHPALQRHMAKRASANTVEWPTAHSPFINRPDLVIDLLVGLAT